jgi:hypothetical protein
LSDGFRLQLNEPTGGSTRQVAGRFRDETEVTTCARRGRSGLLEPGEAGGIGRHPAVQQAVVVTADLAEEGGIGRLHADLGGGPDRNLASQCAGNSTARSSAAG